MRKKKKKTSNLKSFDLWSFCVVIFSSAGKQEEVRDLKGKFYILGETPVSLFLERDKTLISGLSVC